MPNHGDLYFRINRPMLTQARINAGFSQTSFSKHLGFSHGMYNKLENYGTNPTINTVWLIAEALNIDPRDLVYKLKRPLPREFATAVSRNQAAGKVNTVAKQLRRQALKDIRKDKDTK